MPKLNQKMRNRLQNNPENAQKKKKTKVKLFKQKEKVDHDKLEIIALQSACAEFNSSQAETFAEFPLSKRLRRGLQESGYVMPTPIQKESVSLSLKGHDVLGAAKTGSGKTLAFLIPVLECLYKQKWSPLDGLGALIVTPTRELAYQIFEVLRKVGKHFDFSAGLVIGGKDLKFERKRMDRCNVIIGTPGRLLQHMDENPLFTCSTLQILVLDEADRILDLGFQKTMNAIIENLPAERQTLLFSATQTKSVKDLARLSLKDPLYVSVNEFSQHSTPEALQQSYVVCDLHSKFDLLWSFLKHHRKQKILVFMSSCKQVKFTYEIFCRMRPGISVLALYGSMHQMRRMAVYDNFRQKQTAVLFATDIAARGLDFPSVHWVIQLDCPEDANTYIHRAGRTARYEKDGESLLVLLPSEEEAMIEQLNQKKIPINKIDVNPKKQHTIQRKMEACLARDVMLKDSAQRAFVSYLKSIFLMKDKKVFDVQALNTDAYARSLGLATAPRIRFLQRHQKKMAESKAKRGNEKAIVNRSETESSSEEEEPPQLVEIADNMKAYSFAVDDDDDLFTLKRRIVPDNDEDEHVPDDEPILESNKSQKKKKATVTKAAVVKKLLKKKIKLNASKKFDDEGNEVVEAIPRHQVSELAKTAEYEEGGINIDVAKSIMKEEDQYDKKIHRERIKAMHKQQKLKAKESRKKVDDDDEEQVQLGGYESDGEEYNEFIDALPDPDVLYGKKEESDNDENEDNDNNSDNEDDDDNSNEPIEQSPPQRFKRKRRSETGFAKRLKRDETLDTGLTLGDEEELALHFLNAR